MKTRLGIIRGLLVVALFILAAGPLWAEAPVYQDQPSGEFLTSWLLSGPFPLEAVREGAADTRHLSGFETDFLGGDGGETNPAAEDGAAAWFVYDSPTHDVSLDQAVSRDEFVLAYGYCEIESASDCVCVLALGTNDGGRAWLNGEVIWDRPEARGLSPDDDLIPVALRKGRNRLLLKVEERGNLWGFVARFLPFDATAFTTGTALFRVDARRDGTAVLRFVQTQSVLDTLMTSATLDLALSEEPEAAVWRGDWTKQVEMPLPVDSERYGKYVLRIRSRLMDHSEISTEIPFAAGKRVEHVLFEKGATDYAIVVGADASESEKWASGELQHWLKEVSGADFPVVSDAGPARDHEIVVGFNGRAQALLGGEAPDPLDESFSYRNVGPAVVIAGGSARGTMYGVMTFLERELGCRWYTPQAAVTPKKDRFAFDYLRHGEAPGVRVRNDFYFEAFEPIWAARNKINGAMTYREQPGGLECYWAVHTFYQFMPPTEFFEEHPEYYSLIGGERRHDRTQLCLTNPEVFEIVVDRLTKVMRESPEYLIYSVSQNDWTNPCECDACRAIVEREGSESGPIIWFVNQVAERVEPEFPDKFVGTLAYSYTRKPCKTLRPRQNVVVRLCSIECCFAHPLAECPENESFISDIHQWASIAPHLYIWDYVVNFSHYVMPYPNFRALQSNVRTFRDNHAIGIMEQAAYQSRGGEFAELRAYVLAKLLWDPECNVEDAINNFMYGYYGRSGQHVRRYFDLLHGQLTADTHIHLGLNPDDPLFTDEFIRQADAVFDQAEAVADTEEIRQRVEMARLPLMYLKCKRAPLEARHDGTYGRFCAIAEREGVTHYAEAGAVHRQAFHENVEAAE